MGNCISQAEQKEFLKSLQNSTIDSAILDDPNCFRVYAQKKNKFLPGALKVTDREILFFHGCNEVENWPFQYLRRYGFTCGGMFFFESGRRCSTGEGIHTFQTCQSEAIFQLVQGRIQSSATTNISLRDSAGQSIADNIRNARLSRTGRVPPNSRIHPLQRYFSEGMSNTDEAYRSLRMHQHLHHQRHKHSAPSINRPQSFSATADTRRAHSFRPPLLDNESESDTGGSLRRNDKYSYSNFRLQPLRLSASENHPDSFNFTWDPSHSHSEANSSAYDKYIFDRYVNVREMLKGSQQKDENVPASPTLDYASVNITQAQEKEASQSSPEAADGDEAMYVVNATKTVDYTEIDLEKTQAAELATKVLELENPQRRYLSNV